MLVSKVFQKKPDRYRYCQDDIDRMHFIFHPACKDNGKDMYSKECQHIYYLCWKKGPVMSAAYMNYCERSCIFFSVTASGKKTPGLRERVHQGSGRYNRRHNNVRLIFYDKCGNKDSGYHSGSSAKSGKTQTYTFICDLESEHQRCGHRAYKSQDSCVEDDLF